ncbi:hypothetical protein BAX93_05480 [Elizabethkingia meningoseptica]|uniref:hypothetical protein n=1 Tax=Elizabethkingia meningoseptica TaxID=238 RepID=UPI00099AE290|nr:hypothetical protein [Elizabethkingia meningoseptica]OPC11953.1 hypothetical protein BAX93_05480 [Elizabethkingia meningoseptica]
MKEIIEGKVLAQLLHYFAINKSGFLMYENLRELFPYLKYPEEAIKHLYSKGYFISYNEHNGGISYETTFDHIHEKLKNE